MKYEYDINEITESLMNCINNQNLQVLTEACIKECRKRGLDIDLNDLPSGV